jgi:hypothetical protein
LFQINFGALVRIRVMEQIPSASFNKIAGHLNVMMGEIKQEEFEAVQGLGSRVQSEFGQLADETSDFHFGLDVYLVLCSKLVFKTPRSV